MAQDFTVARDSPKRVLHSDGYLKTYAVDDPAFEFKDDGSYRGVLIEPSATNLALQSENLGTTWLFARSSASTDQILSPDNTTTADKLIEDSTLSDSHYVYQQISVTSGTKYTFSIFVKAGERTNVALNFYPTNGAFTTSAAFFNLSSGAITDATNVDDAEIVAYPNGWYRISATETAIASAAANLGVLLVESGTTILYDGDSSSGLYLWGAQVEEGPIATSYIPTTTASVTRNADNISMTGASSLIGQTEGTLFVEVEWRLASGEDQRLLGVNDGTSDNRVLIVKNTSNQIVFLVSLSGSSTTLDVEDASAYDGDYKFALAYKSTDNAVYVNGSTLGALTNDPSISFGATLTDVELGQSAGNQANMWIKSVALFTRRLTNTELAALTS